MEIKLEKMPVEFKSPIHYYFRIGKDKLLINEYLERSISLKFTSKINCLSCNKSLKKTYAQGYCYDCFNTLAMTDICIMSPHLCHYHKGTCRDPKWGENHCMKPHIVYLANSSGPKVGITRETQVPTRWIDQGAKWAAPIIKTSTRYEAGMFERLLSSSINDKTNWRKMLRGDPEPVNFSEIKENLFLSLGETLDELEASFGEGHIEFLENEKVYEFDYPVIKYPEKIKSINLSKEDKIEGTLLGIKGQYLIFDTGVINIRNHGGYHIELSEMLF